MTMMLKGRDRGSSADPADTTATAAQPRVLGQLLLLAGAVTKELLQEMLGEQRATGERIGEALVRRGVQPESVAQALAVQLRLRYEAGPLQAEPAALALVDASIAARYHILPLRIVDRALVVAMADPLDAAAVDDLRFRTGRRIDPAVATLAAVEQGIRSAYQDAALTGILSRLPAAARTVREGDDVGALRMASEAAPVVALVDALLARAVAARASDVHIETQTSAIVVRIRVDGVLRPMLELPRHAGPALASRLKVLSDLDIAVRRLPQDGRAALTIEGRRVAARISSLPAEHGEKIVIRLLDAVDPPPLDSLGLGGAQAAALRRMLLRSHGLVLVTGPTGSGKTTTLHAALGTIDGQRRNIVTLEDPIEYRLPGATQVQIRPRAGLDFARALRAVLRQDPDVIMIGELRDAETARIALAAALTGHLVLATVHTNDAASAATRLVEMGVAPYLVSAALIGVVAQRLARRNCPACAQSSANSAGRAPCDQCGGSGMHGRIGVYEVMDIDETIAELLMRRGSTEAIRRAALAAGMQTMADDARAKVLAALTRQEEVAPIVAAAAGGRSCPCGEPIPRTGRFCIRCGHPTRTLCPCGRPLRPDARHCGACGMRAPASSADGHPPEAPPARPPAIAAPTVAVQRQPWRDD
jgi:type IV pilus assembly protein PilB